MNYAPNSTYGIKPVSPEVAERELQSILAELPPGWREVSREDGSLTVMWDRMMPDHELEEARRVLERIAPRRYQ